ncbi:MAG: bifunctional enoyl-CoA hydratase/phosphate acetyltransferase [Gammaproteobacteria bacterium]|nr:bifunctional enoyl-CoA hydratase/phosphate acetyltransferase [Rhodocyclaceae bacterium]MBU3910789.1 bifunctional enoyl-CoA hydratase/phosphate acetyltransferase [Gammaproteobacteria bacterium]MBU3989410.1 bifunctional enoyl-CoA hydratase/phosphate acetyltransferase [Gammaproteobacteria bacterium]MBU4006243.1 bifunctional enoyl-CoA hydratase/phosphate acetyltransferase [Gammaproteobacteria bacterium]MBU4097850.1 bifunctional enoyl-CoA hydratase/phosphate acetyltransferase [Gammaproteobacteria
MNKPSLIETIENRTYDEIQVGDVATLVRTLRPEDIQMFAIISGDMNPTHVDPEYARSSEFREVVAHGMWGGMLFSNVLGTQFPGPGTIYFDQSLRFERSVRVGDTLTVTITCQRKFDHNHHIIFDCNGTNQDNIRVLYGTAEVIAPLEKIKRPKATLPEIKLSATRTSRYEHLLEITRGLSPISMAVIHPCDPESLKGALLARDRGLIDPTLVGPEDKIRALAEEMHLDLSGCQFLNVPHSHAAAESGVALAREGVVEALMKGSLHTDELMSEVVDQATGLRTERRISHVFVMDVPTYPRPLLITDAAVNVAPDLVTKVDIVQNAIDLALMLHIVEPKVAILAAIEHVNPKMQATLDAAALCKMADRGQIRGGLLDGPLALDNAISLVAARTKGIKSVVAGQADILLVPDIESGNMLAKQLEYLADALSAGIVLGARVPIVLTSRADSARTRMASTAIAVVMAHARRDNVSP